jgi:hypothetical protein
MSRSYHLFSKKLTRTEMLLVKRLGKWRAMPLALQERRSYFDSNFAT